MFWDQLPLGLEDNRLDIEAFATFDLPLRANSAQFGSGLICRETKIPRAVQNQVDM
ncbi:hypothetical protein NSU_3227 [Novosphingobium pentaromativorans US6-1]|uniref:Uncharacterized protein n=1 Tax=Novosphingobium pentaromativorans US6-1 TaxID=1088721 RepID=G6EFV5_9SPHN|nr:hypothetical protein NSU_3227 [Novosphingobium pentaromativorans US6-1]